MTSAAQHTTGQVTLSKDLFKQFGRPPRCYCGKPDERIEIKAPLRAARTIFGLLKKAISNLPGESGWKIRILAARWPAYAKPRRPRGWRAAK
jgi:hypothetical protein